MLNHVALQGRLVKDPDIRSTAGQKTVADIRIAVDRDFKNADGIRGTDFFTVVAFGALAEHIGRYFKKGTPIIVSGRLQQENWQDRDGNKRESIKVFASNVWFGEAKKSSEPVTGGDTGFTPINDDDGDLPF